MTTTTHTLTKNTHRTELGVVTRDGFVYVFPNTPKRSPIKNRLFSPKWVQEELAKGNVIVDAVVEARLDERTGRHYPVVRGKVVADHIVSVRFWMDSFRNIIRTTKWLSGETETKNWYFRQFPKEMMAQVPQDQIASLKTQIREARLVEVLRDRYFNGATERTPKGILSLEKVEFTNFAERTMMVNVVRTYTTDGEMLRYRISEGKIVKTQEDAAYSLIVRREEPIDAHFKVEYGKPYLKGVDSVSECSYESNDGRGMRSDTTYHFNLLRCVDVVVRDNEGNKVKSWTNSEFITGVSR